MQQTPQLDLGFRIGSLDRAHIASAALGGREGMNAQFNSRRWCAFPGFVVASCFDNPHSYWVYGKGYRGAF